MSERNQAPKEFMVKEDSSAKTIGLVLLIAIMFTGIVYFYAADKDATDAMEKSDLESRIDKLQGEINSLKNSEKDTATTQDNPISDRKTYKNDKYGYEVNYSGTLESLDRDNDRIYVSNAQIVDSERNIITTRVLSKPNLPSCADKTLTGQVKCFYMALEQNPDKISQQKFGDNTFVYADFTNLDTNTRDLMAFAEKGDFIYQFEIIDPTSPASEDLFKNILSTFKFSS